MPSRFLLVLLVLLPLLPGEARATDDLDWPRLARAFIAFVADPTATRAAAITALLPPGHRPGYPQDEAHQQLREELELGTEVIQELVERGSLPALRVAFAMGALSDGDWAEWLTYIRAAGAVYHPREYLELERRHRIGDDRPCHWTILVVHWELVGDPRPVLEARLRALESVQAPELAEVKACSIELLRSELGRAAEPQDGDRP